MLNQRATQPKQLLVTTAKAHPREVSFIIHEMDPILLSFSGCIQEYNGCVRLASHGSTPICPRYVRIAFIRHSRGSPGSTPSALLVEWVTWGWPEVHDVTMRGWVSVRLALVRGSPEWAQRGRHREAYQTHTMRCSYLAGQFLLAQCIILRLIEVADHGFTRASSRSAVQ